jgi:16S rRNA (guanine(966)-N(2))-methyltransferase RsmD
MRITGGRLRSRTLNTSGFQGIRPTTDRARETIFNILLNHCDFEDIAVLDLCAGSGALGIEALSRGAASAVFVEKSRKNCSLLADSLKMLDIATMARVVCDDAVRSVAHFHGEPQDERFDMIFCDPPYAAKLINPVFAALAASSICAENSVFIAEHDVRETVLLPKGWQKLTERHFGETIVEFFQKMTAEE